MPFFMLFGSRRFLDCEMPLYGFFLCFSVGQRVVNAFIFDEKPGLNLVRTLN